MAKEKNIDPLGRIQGTSVENFNNSNAVILYLLKLQAFFTLCHFYTLDTEEKKKN